MVAPHGGNQVGGMLYPTTSVGGKKEDTAIENSERNSRSILPPISRWHREASRPAGAEAVDRGFGALMIIA